MSDFNRYKNKSNYTTKKVKINADAFVNEDDFWRNWQIHRDHITSLIDEHIVSKFNHETVAIWGAGKCNDIDLDYLSKVFKEVHLFDQNTNSIKSGLESHQLTDEQISRIHIHSGFDFVGTDDNFYKQIEEMLLAKSPIKQIIKVIRSQANQLNSYTPFQNVNREFDVSISLAVHSQLFLKTMLLLEKHKDYFGKEYTRKLYEECKYLYFVGSKTYNEFLYMTVKPGGVLYTGLDLLEFSPSLDTLDLIPEVNNHITSGKMISTLPKYFNKCGVMGSYEAFRELIEHPSFKNTDFPQNFWIWRYFSFQSYFFIMIGLVKK